MTNNNELYHNFMQGIEDFINNVTNENGKYHDSLDIESRHANEDQLYIEFIEYISKGCFTFPQIVNIAKLLNTISSMEYVRWYA